MALNVVLFVPLGIGLRWLTRRMSVTIIVGFLVTLTVEMLQWRAIPGRYASIGDIVANSVGTALGVWIAGRLAVWWMAFGKSAARIGMRYALVASAVLSVSAELLLPGRSTDPYFVQWARVLRNTDVFTGKLNWAVLNSHRLSPAEVLTSTFDREHSELTASVGISGNIRPVEHRAEILRIGNARSEAMMLGQQESAIVFRAYTRAEHLRIRSPLIALPLKAMTGGRADEDSPGELTISARSTPRKIELTAVDGADTVSVAVRRTIGLSWTLLSPWEVAVGPHWWPANAVWLALLVMPASFFASRARLASHPPGALGGSGAVVTMVVVLGVVPCVIGLSHSVTGEWGGVISGLAFGYALGRLPPNAPAPA
jgi:hypothetical protein